MASLSRTNGVERAPDASVTPAKKWDIDVSVTLTFDASVTREFFTLGYIHHLNLNGSLDNNIDIYNRTD